LITSLRNFQGLKSDLLDEKNKLWYQRTNLIPNLIWSNSLFDRVHNLYFQAFSFNLQRGERGVWTLQDYHSSCFFSRPWSDLVICFPATCFDHRNRYDVFAVVGHCRWMFVFWCNLIWSVVMFQNRMIYELLQCWCVCKYCIKARHFYQLLLVWRQFYPYIHLFQGRNMAKPMHAGWCPIPRLCRWKFWHLFFCLQSVSYLRMQSHSRVCTDTGCSWFSAPVNCTEVSVCHCWGWAS